MKARKKAILLACIMVVCLGLGIGDVYANETREVREREGFEDIGENYFKEVNAKDIVIDEKNGIAYVKNQLLISALIGTDKKVIEDIVKEINADIVGYIALTSDFQIEFREDKTLEELEQIANYIDGFSFVGAVTLNIVNEQDVKPSNSNIKTSDGISEWAKVEVTKAIEHKLIPQDLQNNYQKAITRKEFADLVIAYVEAKKAQSIEDLVKAKTKKEITFILTREKFNDTKDEHVIYAKVLGIVNGVGNNNFHPKAKITREEAATLLYRLGKYSGLEDKDNKHKFKDDQGIASWAKKAVDFVSGYEVMQGVDENHFLPQGMYTREQAYLTLYRLFKEQRAMVK